MPTSSADSTLTVSTDGTAGSYVIVTAAQVGPVTEALHTEGLTFHVDEDAVLLSGMPVLAIIELGKQADVERAQNVMDRVAADLRDKEKRGHRSPTRQELVVRGNGDAMQELRRRLDVSTVKGWTRRADIEERLHKTLPQQTSGYCFSKQFPAMSCHAALLIRGRGPGATEDLYVTGVFPIEGREPLSLEQHNQAITDFRNTLIHPLVQDLSIRILDCQVHLQPSLEEILSSESFARLGSFCMVANKGNLHPLDLRRWAEFIGQTHLDRVGIDGEVLSSWLEDERFSPTQITRLIDEFEAGRQLLDVYDEERREKWPE